MADQYKGKTCLPQTERTEHQYTDRSDSKHSSELQTGNLDWETE